jgi:FAD-NAD(P)-binding
VEYVDTCLDIAIIGMGPRGLSVLERLMVRLEQDPRRRHVRVYIVDPGEMGAGRIWRTSQPECLLMNTAAVEVSLYSGPPDGGAWRAGAGPSLHEWLAAQPDAAERETSPNTYAPRRVYGQYLTEVYRNIIEHLPEGVEVQPVFGRVAHLSRDDDGRYTLRATGGRKFTVNKAVLATGHSRTRADAADLDLLDFASRHPGARYLRGDSAADMDLKGIEPAENIAILGLGLAFFDVASLLTLGRGGRFVPQPDGSLVYERSGREPHLAAGSRSGLPLLARGRNQKSAHYRYEPRFFTSKALDRVRRRAAAVDGSVLLQFREHVLPLVLREIEHVYYSTHVRRRDGEQAARVFAERDAAAENPAELAALRLEAGLGDVPPIDLERMARPFAGESFVDTAQFHDRLIDLLRADAQAAAEGNVDGPLKAALDTLRDTRGVMREAVEFGSLHPDSHRDDFLGWFNPINTMVSAGPPVIRTEQIIALIKAEVLTVVGPGLRIDTDEDAGRFVLTSTQIAGVREVSRLLIDARIPRPNVHIDASPLMRHLIDESLASAHVNINAQDGTRFVTGALAVTDAPFRLIDAAGHASNDLYALGIPTEELRWFTQIGNGRPGPMVAFHSDADAIVGDILAGSALAATDAPEPMPQPAHAEL